MIHLITGGSGSGKSVYAEQQIVRYPAAVNPADGIRPFFYVATMKPYGREAAEKIRRHRMQRMDAGFLTVEQYVDMEELRIPDNAGILLECVSNLTANELYRDDRGEAGRACERIIRGIRNLAGQTEHLVIVTNEVHSDINGYSRETEIYRELLGKVNCELARMADKVTEVVYGIPLYVKGEEDEKIME